jgi:hypothetical protein
MTEDLKKRIKNIVITLKPQGTVTTAPKYKE